MKKRKVSDSDPGQPKRELQSNGRNSQSTPLSQSGSGSNRSNLAAVADKNKLLSCQRCRVRKIKCSFEYPCASCVKAEAECVQTVDDMRKKRPPVNYVTSLEKKISNLTSFLRNFESLGSISAKQALLDKTNLNSLISENNNHEAFSAGTPTVAPPTTAPLVPHSSQDDYDRAIYGPTSVYDDNLITKNAKYFKRVEESSIKLLNNDQDILHCIKLFFTWQYPDHNMFIFREAFLIDFFNPQPSSLYCSKILILSICALGSRMSDSERIYDRSGHFYTEAKNMLLDNLNNPSLTSLQSYLLLAFYDICNGYNSSGWMLSGNAMRMGFDLGFQLNPEVWFVKSKEDLSPLDVDIRSRIYWGSYVADHFISLLLGRPSLLKDSDASIPETNDLPDLEWIDEFTYSGFVKKMEKAAAAAPATASSEPKPEPSYISNPLKKIINLISISDNMLNDIFTKSDLENDTSNHEDLNLISRLEKLYEYNAQIQKWRNSLPPDLQWDRDSLKETAENPTLSCIRYYYYILILCLNRPFVGIFKKALAKSKTSSRYDDSLSPLKMCSDAIEDIYEAIHRFEVVHGFRRVSIFMVYCSILSISVLLLTNTSQQLMHDNKHYLHYFLGVLHGSSRTWKLAEKSFQLISAKLKTRYEDPEFFDDISSQSNRPVKMEPNLIPMQNLQQLRSATPLEQAQLAPVVQYRNQNHNYNNDPRQNQNIQASNGQNNQAQILTPQESSQTENIQNSHTLNETQSIRTQNDRSLLNHSSGQQNQAYQRQQQYALPLPLPLQIPIPHQQNSQLLQSSVNYSSPTSHTPLSHFMHDSSKFQEANQSTNFAPQQSVAYVNKAIVESNTDLLFDKNLDFLGGPPVLMTSDLFNEDWESLFPDYMSNPKN